MEHPVLRIIAITVSVLLILVAGFAMFQYSKEANSERKALEEVANPMNEKLSRLYVQKADLESQLEDVKEEMTRADDKLSSVVILVSEPKKEIITALAPLLDKYGYKGMVAISSDYLPGSEGNLTWEEIDSLINKGWQMCIRANDTTTIGELKQAFTAQGYELPKVVYCSNGACNETDEDIFLKEGFDTVIEYCGFVSDFKDGRLWHVPAQGSRNAMSQTTIQNSIELSEPIVMVIGFEREDELFTEENIKSMLTYIKKYEDQNEILVTDLDTAKARYKEHLVNVGDNAKTLQDDYGKIKEQIDEIDKQIEAIR